MSALLFIITVDWIMRSTLSEDNTGIRWTLFSKLEDLDYADVTWPYFLIWKHKFREKHLTYRYQRKEN
jgi:hypothetical protein